MTTRGARQGIVLGALLLAAASCGGSTGRASSPSTAVATVTTATPVTSPAGSTAEPAPSTTAPSTFHTGGPEPVPSTVAPTTMPTNPVPPLAPGEVPDGATIESADGLAKVSTVTERVAARDPRYAVPAGGSLTRVRVEQCAGADGLAVDPLAWGGVLDDGSSTDAVVGSTEPEVRLAPFGCVAGDVDLVVPDGRRLVSVVLRNQASLERGRWRLNGPWAAPREPLMAAGEVAATLPDVEYVTARGLALTVSDLTLEGATIAGRVHACATRQAALLDPTRWLVFTSYHTPVPVTVDGAAPPKRLDPGGCTDVRIEATAPVDEPHGFLVVVELKEEVARFALGG